MSKKCNEKSIRNLIFHTEQNAWKTITPKHKGYRTALWRILCEHMYSSGDYYVPADELFFGTTALADEVLEGIISRYNFKKPKKIVVIQPRYEKGERVSEIMDIADYLKENEDAELFYIVGDILRVLITEKDDKVIVAILWNCKKAGVLCTSVFFFYELEAKRLDSLL